MRSANEDHVRIGVGRSAHKPDAGTDQIDSRNETSELSLDGSSEQDHESELAESVRSLSAQLVSLKNQCDADIHNVHSTIAEIAIAVAERVLYRSISEDRQAIEEMVRELVGLCGPRTPIVLRLHPADLTLLNRKLVGNEEFTCEADESIQRGNCIAQADTLTASANWQETLKELQTQLVDRMNDATTNR